MLGIAIPPVHPSTVPSSSDDLALLAMVIGFVAFATVLAARRTRGATVDSQVHEPEAERPYDRVPV